MTASSEFNLVPPLRLNWMSNHSIGSAAVRQGSFYGITSAGKLVSLDTTSGGQQWEAPSQYLPHRIAVSGNRIVAYRANQGLGWVDDSSGGPVEHLALSFGASPDASLSVPVIDGRMIYIAVNQAMYAFHQDEGLQFGLILEKPKPHGLGLVGARDLVAVDGRGVPTRYRVGATSFELLWSGVPHGRNAGFSERPFLVTGSRVIIGVDDSTVAYDLATGQIAWQLPDVPARALATDGDTVYVAFHGACIWAIEPEHGQVLWQRQYVYDISVQREYSIVVAGDHVFFGGVLQRSPDNTLLMAINKRSGAFAWMSRAAVSSWRGGMPLSDGQQLFTYSAYGVGAYQPLPHAPGVPASSLTISPSILRGASGTFGDVTLIANLPVSATVSAAAYRTTQGLGNVFLRQANWTAGTHNSTFNASSSDGFSSLSQFGYVLVDITESGGVSYTQALLLPVNAFPDAVRHWGGVYLETMVFHKYISGYPDQTFRPDNMVTRAESATIVAKTLHLDAPSAGFHTRFTDMATHWARNYVLALEERGFIGGFAEPDGSFTFRPDLDITRGQEARILVNAYAVPEAPAGFKSRFSDTQGHWAKPDIERLEAAGYVTGYQEPDGTYTYRPENSVTRAELCAMVVRILNLKR